MGCFFLGDEIGFQLTVLVVVERGTGMKASIVVPRKGSTGNFAARRVIDLVNECGGQGHHPQDRSRAGDFVPCR